ncbi:Zinc finger protein 26 [Plakobranchus ocellatus]|uniref:Zinc finger protein 26 n=1 Tax=Plakobranchus ocellatus TaxID=259542 RepID=A0AAV4B028_9GAST|nr:Zinc finger protein 26 [Plakobranchus ocellatus]
MDRQCCEKKFLYTIETPGVLYLTLDDYGPIYIDFKHKLKVEVLLPTKDEIQTNVLLEPDMTKTVHIPLWSKVEDSRKNLQSKNIACSEKRMRVADKITEIKKPASQDPCRVNEYNTLPTSVESDLGAETTEGIDDDKDIPIQANLSKLSQDKAIGVSNLMKYSDNSQSGPEKLSMAKINKERAQLSVEVATKPQNAEALKRLVEKEKQNLLMLKRRKRTSVVLTKIQLDRLMMSFGKKSKNQNGEAASTSSDTVSSPLVKESTDLPGDEKEPDNVTSGTNNNDKEKQLNTCKYCGFSFPTPKDLEKHWKLKTFNYHVCLKCYTAFPFKAYLMVHQRYHDQKDALSSYKCENCDFTTENMADLKRHTLNHTGEHCFRCCTCTKTFTTHKLLTKHLPAHRPKGLIKCSCCNQFFPSRISLSDHKLSVRKFKCGICGKVFPNRASRLIHYKSDHKDTILRCPLCPLIYSTKKEVANHMKEHGRRTKRQCPICGVYINVLKAHLRTHKSVDEMPESELYMCDQCPKRFKDASSLREHRRRHTHEKVKCHLCPASFFSQGYLTRHLNNVHSSLMPYQCEICGKRCKQKGNLDVHMRIHSDVKKFPCNFCDQGFNYKSSLQGHLRSKHSVETLAGTDIPPVGNVEKNETATLEVSANGTDWPLCSTSSDLRSVYHHSNFPSWEHTIVETPSTSAFSLDHTSEKDLSTRSSWDFTAVNHPSSAASVNEHLTVNYSSSMASSGITTAQSFNKQ